MNEQKPFSSVSLAESIARFNRITQQMEEHEKWFEAIVRERQLQEQIDTYRTVLINIMDSCEKVYLSSASKAKKTDLVLFAWQEHKGSCERCKVMK